MSAGVADFVIEAGADWTVQVYWVAEQTTQAIPIDEHMPAIMDIVEARTGQRLIRLDNGANGGIEIGGAPNGIIQLEATRHSTRFFRPGRYLYDLFVFTDRKPQQRVRLLTGQVLVANPITDLGVHQGQALTPTVLPPDIILDARYTGIEVQISFNKLEPTNLDRNPESGNAFRAGLRGMGNFPAGTPVRYVREFMQEFADDTGLGPVRDQFGNDISATTLNQWLMLGAVITFRFSGMTGGVAPGGIVISRVESEPGGQPSPQILP